MRHAKEDQSPRAGEAIDLISAVKELHKLPSQELSNLLRDSEIFIYKKCTDNESLAQIDADKLARFLPLHLIAVLISSKRDESLLRYMLCGFRLLNSLCDLATRHNKLEQTLLDDVKVTEQMLDLIFHLLLVLSNSRQENQGMSHGPLIHSALVGCSLHLLTQCISPQWSELAIVLLSHPKVDIFMDATFKAVYLDIKSLQMKLSDQCIDFCPKSSPTAEKRVCYLCQQCETSLQFLQMLCQQKMFRERLIRNKELSARGGVLSLAHSILKLNISPLYIEYSTVVAAVSRLKSKVLSILLHLCEVESISFLDEAFSTPKGQNLAKTVALQVLELLRTALNQDPRHASTHADRFYPMGLSQLNALRLIDIFSDDSNFRSHIAVHITEVVTSIFLTPQGEFLSTWCSSSSQIKEEDAALEYDAFASTGWVLDSFSSSDLINASNSEFSFIPNNVPQASYALQRTSLLVKVIANLHCFVPNICKEHEKNLFLNKFIECLQMDQPKALEESCSNLGVQKAAAICKNMRSLLTHSESLIPIFLNEEDIQLFRLFFNQLQSLIAPVELEENRLQEAEDLYPRQNIYLKEEMSESSALHEVNQNYGRKDKRKRVEYMKDTVESSASDSSSARGKNFENQNDNHYHQQSNEQTLESEFGRIREEDEKIETVRSEEKQQRKRKRTIMNEEQMAVIERALLDEPGMQRNAASLQSWADKLVNYGPEVTSSQLKNWLNNRKARLARAAAKDTRPTSDQDKQRGSGSLENSHESPDDDTFPQSTSKAGPTNSNTKNTSAISRLPGNYVALVDGTGDEIGRGEVHQVRGEWNGTSLDDTGTCVVDILELKVEKWARLPYPSEATGATFEETQSKIGVIRVLWDSSRTFVFDLV